LIEASKANKGKVTIGANETNKMGSADLVTLYVNPIFQLSNITRIQLDKEKLIL